MAREFVTSILPKRGPTAFERFMAALMNCPQQQFIAHHLDPEMARRIEAIQEPDVEDKTDDEIIKEVKALIQYNEKFALKN